MKIIGIIAILFGILFVILNFIPSINQTSIISLCTSADPVIRFFCPIGGFALLIMGIIFLVIGVNALRKADQ